MDIKKELGVIKRTGKYVLGTRQTYLSILNKKARVVILASNCPHDKRLELSVAAKMRGVPLIESRLAAREIGLTLGKPFGAAAVAVIDPGSSSLREVEEGE